MAGSRIVHSAFELRHASTGLVMDRSDSQVGLVARAVALVHERKSDSAVFQSCLVWTRSRGDGPNPTVMVGFGLIGREVDGEFVPVYEVAQSS